MDKAALIGPAPYAAKFAADIRITHSNVGLLVDLSHFPTTRVYLKTPNVTGSEKFLR